MKLRPEHEYVVACGRALISAPAREYARTVLRCPLSWPDVARYAQQHRLLPLVYENLIGIAPDVIPASELECLRDAVTNTRARIMNLVRELLRLYPLLDAAGIPILPYKGPVLACMAFGNFLRRDCVDLDFAVPQKHVPDLIAFMQDAGYEPNFDCRDEKVRSGHVVPGQYSFTLPKHNVLVEFHTEATLRYFPRRLDFDDLATRLLHVEISGHRLRTFSGEDTVVLLSVHGAKHFWQRLAWVLDIAALVATRKIDWPLLAEIAHKRRARRVTLLALCLAENVFGAVLPEPAASAIAGDRAVRRLAAQLSQQYAQESHIADGLWRRAIFRVRSRDSLGEGLRHACRLGLSPTEADREVVSLPSTWRSLYGLIRPWRLLREYGFGTRRRS